MAVHDDGTMDVRVNGRMERRTYWVREDIDPKVPWVEHVPELKPGEIIVTKLGDEVPEIVSTEPAESAPKPWVARVWHNGKMYWQGRYHEAWQGADALSALRGTWTMPTGAYTTLDYEP